jgi:ABC-type uncharacterized transport system substrate-binding protein
MKTKPSFVIAASIAFALLSLALTGCDFSKSKQAAQNVLTHHFLLLSTNGYAAALADYGPLFFQSTKSQEWTNILATVARKLGTYRNYTLVGWRATTQAGTSGAGTSVFLQCQVCYSKGYAQESFTLFKGRTDPNFKIVRHEIESPTLALE